MKLFMLHNKYRIEDIAKIVALLKIFNEHEENSPWIAADGFEIMLDFNFGKKIQNNTINARKGIVVKVFLNGETGEIKTVLAHAVTKDGGINNE